MGFLSEVIRDTWFNSVAASVLVPRSLRRCLLSIGGMSLDRTAVIAPRVFFGSRRIKVGAQSTVNYNCFFDGSAQIKIGDNVSIAMGVALVTSSHDYTKPHQRAGLLITEGITIGDGAWIGANVVILPGVEIGRGCVIGAGSVVSTDCEENWLYGGAPARKLRALPGSFD